MNEHQVQILFEGDPKSMTNTFEYVPVEKYFLFLNMQLILYYT